MNHTVIDQNGHTHVYYDEDLTFKHKLDGPSLILKDGTSVWYGHGKIHNDKGPAVIDSTGHKTWWLNGKQVSSSEFKRQTHSSRI